MYAIFYLVLFIFVSYENDLSIKYDTIDNTFIEKLIQQNELLAQQNEELAQQNKLLTHRVEQLEARVGLVLQDTYKTDVRGKRQEQQHVAFSAYPSHEVLNLGQDQIVQFQNVILNEGNGYNQYTGVFTAPRSGVYLLFFQLEDWRHHLSIFHLIVNRNILASAIVKPGPEGQNVQGGNLVFTRLNAGDAVRVSAGTCGNNVDSRDALRTSMFSGCFMYA